MHHLTNMFKYLSMSPTGTQNNRTEAKLDRVNASVSNPVARYDGAPPVHRLATGSLYSSSSLPLFVVIPYRGASALGIARRFARPSGLLP